MLIDCMLIDSDSTVPSSVYSDHGLFDANRSDAFWSMMYFTLMAYSIAAFPFLLFLLPIIGPVIHGALPTAYDRRGALVPKVCEH